MTDKYENPEGWLSDLPEIPELNQYPIEELETKLFGAVVAPLIKSGSAGERIQIYRGSLRAYDSTNRIVWKLLQNTDDNILTLNKRDDDGYGNALNIQDDSDDAHASLNIEFSGNNAGKDLLHLEMTAAMTQARTGLAIEQEGGTVDTCMIGHAKSGTLSTAVGYFENDTDSGRCLYAFNDSASNNDSCTFFRQDAPVETNFYKVSTFDGGGAIQLTLWVANNADPNGTLSGNAGDICLSTNGNIYRCTGTTNWTAM